MKQHKKQRTEVGRGLEGSLDLFEVFLIVRPALHSSSSHGVGHSETRGAGDAVLQKRSAAAARLGDRLAASVGAGHKASLWEY